MSSTKLSNMLSVNNLGKRYGEQMALSDVSFTIAAGERVALLGANGSGKTTTINAICSLLNQDQGEIYFEDKDTKTDSAYLRHIGAVLGGCRNTNWRLTARQNAEYFARLRGCSKKQAMATIYSLEAQLGLAQYAKREVGKLSTGNKQKAALLCALSYQPKLLLLDEPTLGLDMDTVSELQSIIIEQSQALNQGFLITSHDLAFIDKICTRVLVLEQGKLIFDGTMASLKQRLFSYEMRLQLNQTDRLRLNGTLAQLWTGKTQFASDDEQIIVRYDSPEQVLDTMNWLTQQAVKPEDLQINQLSMEMAYHSLLNRNSQDSLQSEMQNHQETK